jgi:HSP20 family protein
MMGALVRWNPFDELTFFSDVVDRQLNRWRLGSSSWDTDFADASFTRTDDGYRLRIPLPGFAPEDVHVEVVDRSLHVRASERDGEAEVARYEQIVTLPASVDASRITASMKHGLLDITLPYQEAVKPRRIDITSEEPKALPQAA